MTSFLRNRTKVTPEATALYAPEQLNTPLSFSALYDRVCTVGDHLLETGVCTGERVGLIMENRPELIELFFAALEEGVSPVLFHHRETAEELSNHWEAVDASLLICSQKTESLARASVENAPVLNMDPPAEEGVHPFHDAARVTARTASNREDEQHVILFTSGSTGHPKPVCLTMENLKASAHASACRLGHLSSDVWYDPLPIHHIGGLAPFVRSTLYGSSVLLKSFSADQVPDTFRSYDVSGASMVPAMLSRILQRGHWSSVPESLRFLLLGGAAVPEDLMKEARDRHLPVYPTYGMTETSSQVATALPCQWFEDPSTVGYPLLEMSVTICGENGDALKAGEEGEIYVDGPSVMEGYFRRPLLNDQKFTEHGFRTGDHGYMDEDGRLHVRDERTDQIVTGGEKVRPEEVVEVLTSHEWVREAVVFGMEDEEWGERVVALVESTGEEASETKLRSKLDSFVNQRLASYKIPKQMAIVEDIPRNPDGAVQTKPAKDLLTDID